MGDNLCRDGIVRAVLLAVVVFALLPSAASAQQSGVRLSSEDGSILVPVASNVLCSDERMHLNRGSVQAWDVCAPKGTPIYPMADGVVEYAGSNNAGGYGTWVYIDHGNGIHSVMAHMIEGSLRVKNGDAVTPWTLVGQVGWTGKTSFGPHVHWEIHYNKSRTSRVQISDLHINGMVKCDFCGQEGEPIVPTGVQRVTNSVTKDTKSDAPGRPTVTVPLNSTWVLLLLSLGLIAIYIMSGTKRWLQHAIYSGMALLFPFLLLALVGVQVSLPSAVFASGQLPHSTTRWTSDGSAAWEVAYKETMRMEGTGCVYDPVKTFEGVTQGTYTRWRMAHNLGPGDVCKVLKENEKKAIFLEYYWIASGADKLPGKLGVSVVDFAFNAGPGQSAKGLAISGGDVKKFNDYRESFYLNARDCRIYCTGWLRRLNHIRSITE
jgi:hypothetical protein